MTRTPFGRHSKLLFRSYLFLVAGLLTVAMVLDLGFGHLQTSQADDERWLEASLLLIESRLAAAPEDRRASIALELSADLGVEVMLLGSDEIASTVDAAQPIDTLVDADGNHYYLREAPSLAGFIRLGPLQTEPERLLIRVVPTVFYLSIFVVVGLWLRPLLKDLNLMTAAAERFAADYRVPLKTANRTTQMTALATKLDDMSTRLSGLIQSQKELIAALSHEMRTPLARIRFALAVIDTRGDPALRERLAELNADVQEIDRLIGTMLDYARLDHPDLQMNWQCVPIEPWLERIGARCPPAAPDIALTTDCDCDAAWMDPRLMGLLVSNLVTNACRYARGRVEVSLLRDADTYRLCVADDGEGIPDAERESIFKAFTRLDDSRNRDTGGYGLGLAIVARIAALHGGEARAGRADPLGGAEFVVTWRAPEPAVRRRG